jgi:hypothetical protein
MERRKIWRVWRWTGLIATIINIAFNYLYSRLPSLGSPIDIVSSKYDSLFTPAGYAFSIWGVIYASFLIYSVCQLLPVHRNDTVYDRLSLPFILLNLLCITWINVFSNDMIGNSVAVITAMLFFGGILFGRAKEAYLYEGNNFWLTVPFSLFLGWISVAAIANISLLLISLNWRGGTLGETAWTSMMIGAAFLLAVVVSIAFKDFIYSLVVGWACIAIWVNNNTVKGTVATIAISAGAILTVWSIGYAIWQFRHTYILNRKFSAQADA